MGAKMKTKDCELYQFYSKKIHFVSLWDIAETEINPEFCSKAEFYFAEICRVCKNRKESGENN